MELAPEIRMELIPGKILQSDSLLLAEGGQMVQQEREEEVEGFGQDEGGDQSGSDKLESEATTAATHTNADITQTSTGNQYGSGSSSVTTSIDEDSMKPTEPPGLDPIIIIIPAVLAAVIICMIVCGIFIIRRWNKQKRNPDPNKEDPYLDGSSTEKVPMPMFEEDVPSVLELEMEELDEWMKKDGETAEDSKCL
ncbi:transmembrane protein 154 isoform X2 [Oreochromis aureus]|uniref:transmembrane protein 154 isoform X2 n=1 Tax=Oreochromis aureus TaxID=47969 RepID=UPI0019547F44|nr:transmembrane protein 154 isoform X2 [Oreochromis aureus]